MSRLTCLLILWSIPALAQSPDTQAVLQELRLLRQEMRAMTLAGQRVQILLYRIQLQDDVTKRAAQRHEQASVKVRDAERARARILTELKATEDKLAGVQDRIERDRLEAYIRQAKQSLEIWSQDDPNYRAAEMSAGNELRAEQAKLSELQQRLDRLEIQLESLSTTPAAK